MALDVGTTVWLVEITHPRCPHCGQIMESAREYSASGLWEIIEGNEHRGYDLRLNRGGSEQRGYEFRLFVPPDRIFANKRLALKDAKRREQKEKAK